MIRVFVKTAIGIFCVWHMSAVLIYSLYGTQDVPVLGWLESKRSLVRPYMLTTSQWQRWNLFSPDPLRRVITLDISQEKNGEWKEVMRVSEHEMNFFRRAPELKLIRRMEESNHPELFEAYLYDVCRTENLEAGVTVRMQKHSFIIPKYDMPRGRHWWRTWEPEWQVAPLFETKCPELT